MANAWITGARGFIGRHLGRTLQSEGYTVAGIGHGAWPDVEAVRWGLSAWLNGEVTASNLGQLRDRAGLPDVIYHLAGGSSVGAAIANPLEDFHRSVVSTAKLLEWLRQTAPHTPLVAVSSAAVYGSAHPGPIAEVAALRPYSPYGAHKLMMEDICRSYAANFGVRSVLPRLFSVYGVELKKQLLWDLCGKIALGGSVELGGTGAELRDWIEVRDVCRILVRIADFASVEAPPINVASGTASSVRDIAGMVFRSWRLDGNPRPLNFSGKSRQGDPFCLVANVDLMRSRGLEPEIALSAGVADYIAWYRAQAATTS